MLIIPGLAYKIANEYYHKVQNYYEYDDAQQVCLEGLVHAAQTFDNTRGVSFSTYAYTVIKRHLLRQPIIENHKQQNAYITSVCSLDALLQDEENTLIDIVPDNFNLEDQQMGNAIVEALYRHIDELNDVHKQIMLYRCQDKTFKEIGIALGLKESVVQQQYKKALNILRYKFERDGSKYE